MSITATQSNGKVALITGASRGIGRECAIKLAKEGYTVAVGCTNQVLGQNTVDAILNNGGKAILCVGDVRYAENVSKMRNLLNAQGIVPDTLILCAGVAYQNLFQYTNESDYDKIMDTNVKGVYNVIKEFLPDMISQKRGNIVTMSSMWGQTGGSCEVIYSASKAAIIGMTKALAKEVAPSGIRVNCVSPGVIETDMTAALGRETLDELASDTPLGRNGTPEDVANCVSWLCSDTSSFVTGQIIAVNGGIIM